jgi:beta-N-acetylhexosaminidase
VDFPRDVQDLSLSELIGEALMPRLQIETYIASAEYRRSTHALIEQHKVGGFCVFGGAPETVRSTLRELQQLVISSHGIPLLFSADFEFGLPMRLTEGGTEFPEAMAIGKTGDTDLAYQTGAAIADEMMSLGIHWNFAPVADINSNPENPIINTRSFGDTSEVVADFASAYLKGIEKRGAVGCLKHFPGHGDTSVDSHRTMPVLDGGLSRFDGLEFIPFKRGIAEGAEAVMLGHIATPQLAKEFGADEGEMLLPATLSKVIVQGVLRDKLGFDGVVVTDALEMHAISDQYGDVEAAVMCYRAGVDVLLLSPVSDEVHVQLLMAVEQGTISESHARESAKRVLALKRRVSTPRKTDLPNLESQHAPLALEIARRALAIRGTPAIGSEIVLLHDARGSASRTAEYFRALLASGYPALNIQVASSEDIGGLKLSGTNPVTIATFNRARGFIDNGGLHTPFVQTLTNVIDRIGIENLEGGILFGNPYLEKLFDKARWVIQTFSESKPSVEAVVERLKS